MSDKKAVTVLVFGQEYNLSGDMPRDYVLKIADHVDALMRRIAEGQSNQPMSAIAVLAAMLVADEYYRAQDTADGLQALNQKLDEDAKNYERMWEDVKVNFSKYKEDMDQLNTSNEALQRYAAEKEKALAAANQQLVDASHTVEMLKSKIAELQNSLNNSAGAPAEASKRIAELETRCRDIESSFFDIQMENIRLKNELETYKASRY